MAQEYGGLHTNQARRFKQLEKEIARLKKLVAEMAIDYATLTEAEGDFNRKTAAGGATRLQGRHRLPWRDALASFAGLT